MTSAEPFKIAIPDAVLADLAARLKNARWAPDFANDDWTYGTNRQYLRGLVDYWRDTYDWRAQEADMNRFDHYRTTLSGVPIHFIHQKGKGPKPAWK